MIGISTVSCCLLKDVCLFSLQYLAFTCGILRGALANTGLNARVQAQSQPKAVQCEWNPIAQ